MRPKLKIKNRRGDANLISAELGPIKYSLQEQELKMNLNMISSI